MKMKQKKRNKRGFTLVEVIVVLVVLAILAAILVPSMIGWINKADEKTAVVEASQVLKAAQAIASEMYADSGNMNHMTDGTFMIKALPDIPEREELLELAELTEQSDSVGNVEFKNWKVDTFTYETDQSKITYHATAGEGYKKGFTVEPK